MGAFARIDACCGLRTVTCDLSRPRRRAPRAPGGTPFDRRRFQAPTEVRARRVESGFGSGSGRLRLLAASPLSRALGISRCSGSHDASRAGSRGGGPGSGCVSTLIPAGCGAGAARSRISWEQWSGSASSNVGLAISSTFSIHGSIPAGWFRSERKWGKNNTSVSATGAVSVAQPGRGGSTGAAGHPGPSGGPLGAFPEQVGIGEAPPVAPACPPHEGGLRY